LNQPVSVNDGKKTWAQATAPLRLPLWGRVVREIVAIFVWATLIVNVFVVDLLTPALAYSPAAAELYRFRFFILLGVVAVAMAILPKLRFWSTVGYVLFYPIVFAVWLIPRVLVKNWPIFVVFLPAVHSLISSFRVNFALLALALISAAAVVFAESRTATIVSMVILLLYLARHYFIRIRTAFAPSTVFANVGGAIRTFWESTKSAVDSTDLSGLGPDSEEYEKALAQNLLNHYLIVALLHRISTRLRIVHETRQLDLYFVAALLYTFLITVTVFSLVYIGLLRVDPSAFSIAATSLEMIGYSIGAMLHFQLSDVRPLSLLAQMLTYSESFSSIVIGLLLVFIILTSTRERYRRDLESIADELSLSSGQLEAKMIADYDMTVRAVEVRLMKFNALIARWCLRSRYGDVEAVKISAEIDRLVAETEEIRT
jgi:hypothetical protein